MDLRHLTDRNPGKAFADLICGQYLWDGAKFVVSTRSTAPTNPRHNSDFSSTNTIQNSSTAPFATHELRLDHFVHLLFCWSSAPVASHLHCEPFRYNGFAGTLIKASTDQVLLVFVDRHVELVLCVLWKRFGFRATFNPTNMVPNIELVGTSAGRREYTAVEDIWNLRCLCLRFLLFLRSPTARDAKQALPTFHKYCKLHEARIHHFLSTRVIGGLKYINPGSRRQKADPQSASAPVVGSVKCTNLHW